MQVAPSTRGDGMEAGLSMDFQGNLLIQLLAEELISKWTTPASCEAFFESIAETN